MCSGGAGFLKFGTLTGLLSLAILLIILFSNGWIYTKEPYKLPNINAYTSVNFKIGFWKFCYTFRKINITINIPAAGCTSVGYSNWSEIVHPSSTSEFTTTFVSTIRWSAIYVGIGLLLLVSAVTLSALGYRNRDNRCVVASVIYTLSTLSICTGLFVLVSFLTATTLRYSSHKWSSSTESVYTYDYSYGWCFFAAGIICFLNIISAISNVSIFYTLYEPVDDKMQECYKSQKNFTDKGCLAKLEDQDCEDTNVNCREQSFNEKTEIDTISLKSSQNIDQTISTDSANTVGLLQPPKNFGNEEKECHYCNPSASSRGHHRRYSVLGGSNRKNCVVSFDQPMTIHSKFALPSSPAENARTQHGTFPMRQKLIPENQKLPLQANDNIRL